jgi:hypothetical protein
VAFALILSGCGATNEQAPVEVQETVQPEEPEATPVPAFDLEAYKSEARALLDLINEAEPWVAGLVNYNTKYAENARSISGKVNYEAMLEAAKEYSQKHGVDWVVMGERTDKIQEAYMELLEVDTQDSETGKTIKDSMKILCEDYMALYKFATAPDAVSESTINTKVSEYVQTKDTLSSLYLR